MKPTQPKHFWTRSLATAKRNSSTSLHMGKGSIRTWLYFKMEDTAAWVNSVPANFQYLSSTMAMNAPADEDPITAGLQEPATFPTLAKLFQFYINDTTLIKQTFMMRNILPTVSVQRNHFMTLSWFDFNPLSSFFLDSFAASAPTLNTFNIKERLRQIYTIQMREYNFGNGENIPRMRVNRKFSIRKFMGHTHADYQSPVLDPAFPVTIASAFRFYGTGGSVAPVNPVTIIYHHFVVINLGGMIDAGSLFPATTSTQTLLKTDLAHYTQFYAPLTYAAPANL